MGSHWSWLHRKKERKSRRMQVIKGTEMGSAVSGQIDASLELNPDMYMYCVIYLEHKT